MNVAAIRGFLLVHPKPSSVRVTTQEDQTEVLQPGKSFARLAETIAALKPALIECLDAKDTIIRARAFDGSIENPVFEREQATTPAIPVGLQNDPNALLLSHFANLLHRAYEHSTEIAFTKVVETFDRVNSRAESIEQRLERAEAMNRRMYAEQAEDAIERAEEQAETAVASDPNALVQQMAGAFLSGQMQKAATPSNGKGSS